MVSIELMAAEKDDPELDFLHATTGRFNGGVDMDSTPEVSVLLAHTRFLVQKSNILSTKVLNPEFSKDLDDRDRIFRALYEIVLMSRQNNVISIKRAINQLVEREVLMPQQDRTHPDLAAVSFLFTAIGISTRLYLPSEIRVGEDLGINPQGLKCFTRSSIPLDLAIRPPDEFLRAMGEVLPQLSPDSATARGDNPTHTAARKFHVSHLNASILKDLAGIKITWVDTVGSHLVFDAVHLQVYLYRLPSFCHLHTSHDTMIAQVTKDLSESRPVSVPDLMREIMLSYSLIFKDDRRARMLFKKERFNAKVPGYNEIDPLLERLCGMDLSNSRFAFNQPVRETYDADTDFPILSQRLSEIQSFAAGIEPSRWKSLWKDRRDLKLWYTIWIVLILGLISIIQAGISLVLGGVQIYVAVEGNRLQALSN